MNATRIVKTTAVLGVVALLAACASGLARKEDGAKFRYQDYAGAPVDSMDTMGRISGWSAVSRDQLVLWTGVNEAWLVKVWSTCRDLEFANSVAVKRSGIKVTKFDQVLVGEERCQISEIRPVDIKQMKADRAAAKAKP